MTSTIAPIEHTARALSGATRREGSAVPPGGVTALLAKLEAEQAQGDPSWAVDGMFRRVLELITTVWNDTEADKRAAA